MQSLRRAAFKRKLRHFPSPLQTSSNSNQLEVNMATNTRVLLKEHPTGKVTPAHLAVVTEPVPEPKEETKDVLVKVLYLSLDPYMRGRMRKNIDSYFASFEQDKVLNGGAVGVVAQSFNPGFQQGDIVMGMFGWEQFTVVKNGEGLTKISPAPKVPLYKLLGILGMPGFTAHYGLLELGKPKEGDVVFVSAASGAVGMAVGQIAKLKGCYVIGSAGSDEKVEFILKECGFDAAFNYKTVASIGAGLDEILKGRKINIYFENVGSDHLEAVLPRMADFGRIPFCGMVSDYNKPQEEIRAPKGLFYIITKRLSINGFIVSDHYRTPAYPQFMKDVSGWLAEGKIVYREDIVNGIENAPEAFCGLLEGKNFGKLIIRVAEDAGADSK